MDFYRAKRRTSRSPKAARKTAGSTPMHGEPAQTHE
jgi:hypothetical protein